MNNTQKRLLALRVLNSNAVLLASAAIVHRFMYFAPQTTQEIVTADDGLNAYVETTETRVQFVFVMSTLFMLIPMTVLFLVMDLRLSQVLTQYLCFLDYSIGKGLWLVMIALMVTETESHVDYVLAVLIIFVGLLNVVKGAVEWYMDRAPPKPKEVEPSYVSTTVYNKDVHIRIRECKAMLKLEDPQSKKFSATQKISTQQAKRSRGADKKKSRQPVTEKKLYLK